MSFRRIISTLIALLLAGGMFVGQGAYAASNGNGTPVYDEAAYTDYVETTMKKLDKLYLEFCSTCNVDASKAEKARREYYKTVRELLQKMNARFDDMDPKKGAALSSTEVLVDIHVLTMLVDMLTATQMANMADHPNN
ncbi:MAG: hypothetical protein LJE74_01020 [Proteobacteria bacterium]|jgi:hypothetical protein|nr:hypothetical protein [Pseudomonadota bacterium]MCG6935153.1 hypothetical protein [Pseudomonadota bacterium]